MMKWTIPFVILCLMHSLSIAQPPDTVWTRQLGADTLDEICYSVQSALDGGYILAGTVQHGQLYRWMLAKVSGEGDLQWMRAYGEHASEESQVFGYAAADSGFFLARSEDDDFCLTKVNADGDSLWSHYYSGGDALAFKMGYEAADGGCLLLGIHDVAQCDVYAVRVDSAGNELWSHTWGTDGWDYPRTGVQMPNGDWTLLLWYHVFEATEGWIVRIADDGDSVWAQTFPSVWYSYAFPLGNGGCAVGGSSPGGGNAIAQISDEGSRDWSMDFNYIDAMTGMLGEIVEGQIITLHRILGGDFDHFGLLCTEIGEDTLWIWMDSTDLAYTNIVGASTPNGELILAGNVETSPNHYDLYMVRLAYPSPITPQPAGVAERYDLSTYPNPFNPVTTISFSLPHSGNIRLSVHDIMGREVKMLIAGVKEAGEYRVLFDGSDLPSGIYFARLQSGKFEGTQKLLLLK